VAKRVRRMTQRRRQQSRSTDVIVTDGLWTWTKRGVTAACFIGGGLWYAFQFYSQVQGLKDKVDALWQGQGTIMQTIADVKTSVSQIAQSSQDKVKKK
jgi:hypothetical protein